MTAGRELDALVATEVMGQHVCDRAYADWPRDVDTLERVPAYSTDIAAAWQVVEHHWHMDIEQCNGQMPRYTVEVWNRWGESWHAEADTAPLAICLAALRAVGIETEAQ